MPNTRSLSKMISKNIWSVNLTILMVNATKQTYFLIKRIKITTYYSSNMMKTKFLHMSLKKRRKGIRSSLKCKRGLTNWFHLAIRQSPINEEQLRRTRAYSMKVNTKVRFIAKLIVHRRQVSRMSQLIQIGSIYINETIIN